MKEVWTGIFLGMCALAIFATILFAAVRGRDRADAEHHKFMMDCLNGSQEYKVLLECNSVWKATGGHLPWEKE